MLVELSVVEQRYQAVLAVVQGGWTRVKVDQHVGVTPQTVANWIRRYEAGGLAALADRSHRPQQCPHQVPAAVEAQICEMRRCIPAGGHDGSLTSWPGWDVSRCRRARASIGA